MNIEDKDLDNAIDHVNKMLSDVNYEWSCVECMKEHIQLRDWLVELRNLRCKYDVMMNRFLYVPLFMILTFLVGFFIGVENA